MTPSLSTILCVWILAASCGSERNNPEMPNEDEPVGSPNAAEADAEVFDGQNTQNTDFPIETDAGTIINPPQEDSRSESEPINCSRSYEVSASTNPFLAGMPDASIIDYTSGSDKAPVNSPVQLLPGNVECMKPGNYLYFKVDGKISVGDPAGGQVSADGLSTLIVTHKLGNVNHIAATNAPMGSLIGVFLDDTPTPTRITTPRSLRFGRENLRNFKMLAPDLGQIFFIGDGKDSIGAAQAFLIPPGGTRLFVATMDADHWNNNFGKFTVQASWFKP